MYIQVSTCTTQYACIYTILLRTRTTGSDHVNNHPRGILANNKIVRRPCLRSDSVCGFCVRTSDHGRLAIVHSTVATVARSRRLVKVVLVLPSPDGYRGSRPPSGAIISSVSAASLFPHSRGRSVSRAAPTRHSTARSHMPAAVAGGSRRTRKTSRCYVRPGRPGTVPSQSCRSIRSDRVTVTAVRTIVLVEQTQVGGRHDDRDDALRRQVHATALFCGRGKATSSAEPEPSGPRVAGQYWIVRYVAVPRESCCYCFVNDCWARGVGGGKYEMRICLYIQDVKLIRQLSVQIVSNIKFTINIL